jgi:glutathione S-transferase
MTHPALPHLPLLYSYRRCPYAMRARMALLQAGRPFQLLDISLRDKPATLLALSPKATVPVLHLPSGQVLEQSWDIMHWAWSGADPQGWWARAHSPDNLALLACNDGDFKQHLDHYKYPGRDPQWGGNPEAARAAAVAALLAPLERRLQSAPCLGGSSLCATDLAVFPFVRQFAAVQPDWFAAQPWPALQAWLAGQLQSPLFAACMLKQPAHTVVSVPLWPG